MRVVAPSVAARKLSAAARVVALTGGATSVSRQRRTSVPLSVSAVSFLICEDIVFFLLEWRGDGRRALTLVGPRTARPTHARAAQRGIADNLSFKEPLGRRSSV